MDANRRQEYRALADVVIHRLELPGEPPVEAKGHIRELSASGCRLETSVKLAVDQVISLDFHLGSDCVIRDARARVVRRLSQRSHKVVALEFMNLPEADQLKVREFIVWRESQKAEE